MSTAFPAWYLQDLKYLFQNEDIEMGVLPIRNPKNYAQPQKEMYHFHSTDIEWEIQMVLHTQKSFAIIDYQQRIKSKKTEIDSQGESMGIQN